MANQEENTAGVLLSYVTIFQSDVATTQLLYEPFFLSTLKLRRHLKPQLMNSWSSVLLPLPAIVRLS